MNIAVRERPPESVAVGERLAVSAAAGERPLGSVVRERPLEPGAPPEPEVRERPLESGARECPLESHVSAPRVAQLVVYEDMEGCEAPWRALEACAALATPYQRYEFLHLWQRHVGSEQGVRPFIVVAFNAAREPLFLWPFGRRRVGGLQAVEFLGGRHANFNMALWRRDVAATITGAELVALLHEFDGRVDVFRLLQQPLTWAGTTNPFALLPRQRAPNSGFSGGLAPGFDALLRARTNAATRKKMRKKADALACFGRVTFARAMDPCEVRRVLDVFFKQKSVRMRTQGLPDTFGGAGVRRFIEAAATQPAAGGAPPIEVYALSVDDIIVATMGGIVGGGRFCAMFNSIIEGRFAAESPGEQLLLRLVEDCCRRGLTTFDLGVGEARYKNLFCRDIEPLFDNYIPLSRAGRLLAFAGRGATAVKRTIKQHPALWSMVRRARRLRARLSPTP